MTLEIITVSSHRPSTPYYTYDAFFKSLERYNFLPMVLGDRQTFKGLGSKPKLLLKYLKESKYITTHVIFCDCWDLVFAWRPKDILTVFLDMNIPFLCSAEKNCFPADLKREYDALNPPFSYKYLNSGFMIAERDALITVLESMELGRVPDDYRQDNGQMVHINDQFLFQQAFLKQPVPMYLDYKQEICQNLCMVTPEEINLETGFISNLETGKSPMVFHFNGPAKDAGLREPILKKLELL